MATFNVSAGATSFIAEFPIFDSSSTTGATKSGMTYSTLTCYYHMGASAGTQAVTLTAGTAGTYSSGSSSAATIVEVDATHMPGIYQISIPNAAIASGNVTFFYITGTGCVPVILAIQLLPVP